MKFILGKKQEMTQVFDAEGRVTPATVIKAEPAAVTQIKTVERDGYNAVQVGAGEAKHVSKAQAGHFAGSGSFAHVREYRPRRGKAAEAELHAAVDVSAFEPGDKVAVSGISKGKGFQGGVKRHGFSGGPKTHGQKHSLREPGSIGATGPQRVFKGTKMAGRMGADRVTVKGLSVVSVDPEAGTIVVSGAVPGHRGTLLEVRGKDA